MTINFKAPEIKELQPRLLVLGVGGAGGNAINEMIENNMLFFIFACFNNFGISEILPSLSNCKLILSDNIDVAKKSLFSSNGFKESIAFVTFSILSCGHASIA